jgi:ATP-binding cassette subfamily C protein CydCD
MVGPSGGGKSSIVRLLLRFYDPMQVRSASAARPARAVLRTDPLSDLRGEPGHVPLPRHGRGNILMGRPDAAEARGRGAARAANIHDFVDALPQGYRTVIGEKGIKLSGGQRQRVAIARALLRDTPILVLDEALSAVDAENEAVIQEALDRLMRGRTTLILAHRLSSVIDCDRILVLDGGRCRERATRRADEGRWRLCTVDGRAGARICGLRDHRCIASSRAIEAIADSAGRRGEARDRGHHQGRGLTWLQLIAALMR